MSSFAAVVVPVLVKQAVPWEELVATFEITSIAPTPIAALTTIMQEFALE